MNADVLDKADMIIGLAVVQSAVGRRGVLHLL